MPAALTALRAACTGIEQPRDSLALYNPARPPEDRGMKRDNERRSDK